MQLSRVQGRFLEEHRDNGACHSTFFLLFSEEEPLSAFLLGCLTKYSNEPLALSLHNPQLISHNVKDKVFFSRSQARPRCQNLNTKKKYQ